MRLSRRSPLFLYLWLGLICGGGGVALAAAEPPVLLIESAPALSSTADRVRGYDPARLVDDMRLVGLERPGPPIRVVLVEEGSEAARAAPSWATGYANGAEGLVVLIPARSFSYPYGSLEALLHHEITHVFIARASGGRPVPRWFNEGVAMAAAWAWDVEDRTRLVIEMLPGGKTPFSTVDQMFLRGRAPANRAYALSGAFVRDLLREHGETLPGRILSGLARGDSFEDAFQAAAGTSLLKAESGFYRRQNIWSRWVPFLTSAGALWTSISLLALFAIKRRREKDERIRRQWEVEEPAPEVPENGHA